MSAPPLAKRLEHQLRHFQNGDGQGVAFDSHTGRRYLATWTGSGWTLTPICGRVPCKTAPVSTNTESTTGIYCATHESRKRRGIPLNQPVRERGVGRTQRLVTCMTMEELLRCNVAAGRAGMLAPDWVRARLADACALSESITPESPLGQPQSKEQYDTISADDVIRLATREGVEFDETSITIDTGDAIATTWLSARQAKVLSEALLAHAKGERTAKHSTGCYVQAVNNAAGEHFWVCGPLCAASRPAV